jgi:uncharacterized protein YbjT (DUF2867 family)
MSTVFISGATGYLGRPLTRALTSAGHDVYALTRPQSIKKLPIGCTPIPGNALDASTFIGAVPGGSTYIHLTGVSHPSPAKAAEFRSIDQASFEASLQSALAAKSKHFIYVSVAQPAPVMREYIEVRRQCEIRIEQSGLNATILRPWYILGPGHRWPYFLIPLYKLAEHIPAWRDSALRLGLVTHRQMLAALVHAANDPNDGVAYCDVQAIRAASFAAVSASPTVLSPNRRSSDLSA